jgi:geranylgeranyl pyrophosphate synthase
MAAQLAGAADERVAAYAAFGRALGTAAQLRSECYESFAAPDGTGLDAKALPVALYLDRLDGERRDDALRRLARVGHDPVARDAFREELGEGAVAAHAALRVEIQVQRGLRALAAAAPLEPAAGALRALIAECSVAAPATHSDRVAREAAAAAPARI